jgi:ABC-type transporter Mla MlaB component
MAKTLKIDYQAPTEGRLIISINGDFVLDSLEKECSKLADYINQYSEIQISLSQVSEMDLAAYQFLVFILNQHSKNKTIKINANVDQKLKNIFKIAGINLDELNKNQ